MRTTTNNISTPSGAQWLKSALANPVVVSIDAVLNTACRTAASPEKLPAFNSATSTITEATANTPT